MRVMTIVPRRAGIVALVSAWIGRRQQNLSDAMHAAGDEHAREHGWDVTKTTGRFGFGARGYRDSRFGDQRQIPAEARMLCTAEWLGDDRPASRPTEDQVVGNKAGDYRADGEAGE